MGIGLIAGMFAAGLCLKLLAEALRMRSWEHAVFSAASGLMAVAATGNAWHEFAKTFH